MSQQQIQSRKFRIDWKIRKNNHLREDERIDKICTRLSLSNTIAKKAKYIMDIIKIDNSLKNTKYLEEACIYIATLSSDINLSQREIAQALHANTDMVSKRYREIIESLEITIQEVNNDKEDSKFCDKKRTVQVA